MTGTTSGRALGAWLLAAVAVLGPAGCSADEEPKPDPAQAVQASYRSYAGAVAAKDGETSAGLPCWGGGGATGSVGGGEIATRGSPRRAPHDKQ